MNFKKIFSLILSFTIVLSSLSSTLAVPADLIGDTNLPQEDLFTGTSISRDVRAAELSNEDLVRVVVEMETPNIVTQLSDSGLNYQNISKNEIASLSEELYSEQESLKNSISKNNANIQYHYNFAEVFNGFSATTTYGNALAIEDMPNVKRVTLAIEYERPKPQMLSSHEIIESEIAWTSGFDGEGMVVAVLDTGVDSLHQDMKLSADTIFKLDESDVSGIDDIAPGKWFTEKVPFGYNYMDKNLEILDLGPEASMHGMHVAGSVGANGKIKGVAPEAQILAMKVFGNDPKYGSTFGDIYVKAIEDSVRLGADVINMSLGSTASFVIEEDDDPARVAIRKATEAGLIVAVSAGNSAHFGNGSSNPLASNPDIGLIGSPSLNPETLSVASVENLRTVATGLTHKGALIPYILSGEIDPVIQFPGDIEYIFAGLGSEEELASVDVKDKIALIQRGSIAFSTKIVNAQNAGAKGVIVFNSAAGGNEIMGMSYGDDAELIKIPALFIGVDNGLILKDSAKKIVSFKGEEVIVSNPKKGKMSDFTSWGTTPSLDFKPEITAPGGQIYSTLNNNSYGMMSGTSMAAPHVAGGSAVVLQRISKDFPSIKDKEKSILAKNILMNTAMPLVDNGMYNNEYKLNNYVSPRRHGAGVMNLSGATSTNVIVTSPNDDNLGKVSLKEMGDKIEFPLEIRNLGEASETYNLLGTVTTDMVSKGRNILEADGIFKVGTISENAPWVGEYPISFSANGEEITEITVPAGETVSIKAKVDLTEAIDWMYNKTLNEIFPNGTFVEGFVILKDKADKAATLSVPYMGFYGEWDKAPVIDTVSYEGTGFYGNMTLLTYLEGDSFKFLGINPETGLLDDEFIYISSDGNGIKTTRALMTFLRNAKEVKIEVLDENGSVVRTVAESNYVRKNYYDRGLAARFNSLESWTWDGKINGTPAKNGQYYYKVSAVIDYKDATAQEIIFPVKVDSDLPEVNSFKVDTANKLLIVEAKDNVAVANYKYVIKKGDKIIKEIETKDTEIDIAMLAPDAYTAQVFAFDYAQNYGESEKIVFGDINIPTINMTSPEPYSIHTESDIIVVGNVVDATTVGSITIIHEDENSKSKEYELKLENNEFSLELNNLKDGLHTLRVGACDELDNAVEFKRTFFVDREPAKINLTETEATVSGDTETYKLVSDITDNFPNLEIRINGNYIDSVSGSDATRESIKLGAKYELNEALMLQYGVNNFLIEVKDYAGNIATKEFKVTRGSEDIDINIDIQSPTALELINQKEVKVIAKITNNSESPLTTIAITVGNQTRLVEIPKKVEEKLEAKEIIEIEKAETVETPEAEVVEAEKAVETPEAEVVEAEKAVETPEAEVLEAEKAVETPEAEVVEAEEEVEIQKAEVVEVAKADSAQQIIEIDETFTDIEDGIYTVNIEATLENGNKIDAKRKIFVDTEAPVLEITDAKNNLVTISAFTVPHDIATWSANINAIDNSQGLTISINDKVQGEEKAKWVNITEYIESILSVESTLKLNFGENKFNIRAYDEMGNITSKEIIVTRENGPIVEPDSFKMEYKATHENLVSSFNPINFVATTNNDAKITVEIRNSKGMLVATRTTENLDKELSYSWAPEVGVQDNGKYVAHIKATDGEIEKIEMYNFEVYNYPILIQSIESEYKDGLIMSKAAVKNITNEDQEVMLLIQIKESGGKKVSISYVNQTISAGKTITMSSGADITKPDNYSVEAYVWTNWDSKQSLSESKNTTQKIN